MKSTGVLSTVEVRRQNRNRVYRYLIGAEEPVTRQELARELSMSLPTLTQNLTELTEMGLLQTVESTNNTGGRRPQLISALPEARIAVGVELTNGHIRMVALDLWQREIAYRQTNKVFENSDAYGRELTALLEQFLDEHELDRGKLLGIGITVPGIVSKDYKTLEYAPTIGIRRATPCRFLNSIPYPFFLDNDATCGGYGEWWNRSRQENTAFLTISSGVGGAILVNGSAYNGNSHRSAEFGHMCIHPGGRLCNCGRRGCVEAYCSAAVLADDLDAFFRKLESGDAGCEARLQDYLEDVAVTISNIHVILDCDVTIGGIMSKYLPAYQSRLMELLERDNPGTLGNSYFRFSQAAERSICVGAATRLVERFVSEV